MITDCDNTYFTNEFGYYSFNIFGLNESSWNVDSFLLVNSSFINVNGFYLTKATIWKYTFYKLDREKVTPAKTNNKSTIKKPFQSVHFLCQYLQHFFYREDILQFVSILISDKKLIFRNHFRSKEKIQSKKQREYNT